ncbi:MAG: hypothetical protein AB7F86_00975 [Bdellovibrionales bacterium]
MELGTCFRIISIIGFASTLACSKVGFAGSEAETQGSNTINGIDGGGPSNASNPDPVPPVQNPPTTPPSNPPTVLPPDVVIQNCALAQAMGSVLTSTQSIVFEDTKVETGRAQVCEWEVGDNLSKQDGTLRARYEQTAALNLPAGAVVCDVQMQTPLQKFQYDDVFFLTFNNRILASNDMTAVNRLTPEGKIQADGKMMDLYQYDWLGIRTAPFQNNTREDYCLGATDGISSCTWPLTEQAGDIIFQFHPELFIRLGLADSVTNQKFGFIITGDNDPSTDCYHEKLEFSMTVKYYIPQ